VSSEIDEVTIGSVAKEVRGGGAILLEDRVEPLARHDIGDHIARRNEVNFVRLPAWATAQAADAVGVAVLQQLLIERDVQSGPQGVEQRISAAPWNAAHSQFGPAGVGSCARIIAIRKIDPSQVGFHTRS